MSYFVYIVKCKDESLYTGSSNNVARRVYEHNNSYYGAKSLRGKRPVTLVYIETLHSKIEALKKENEIKGWNRKKKQKLIESSSNELNTNIEKGLRLR